MDIDQCALGEKNHVDGSDVGPAGGCVSGFYQAANKLVGSLKVTEAAFSRGAGH